MGLRLGIVKAGNHPCFHCLTWRRRVDSGVNPLYALVCFLQAVIPFLFSVYLVLGFGLEQFCCKCKCLFVQISMIWNHLTRAKWVPSTTPRQVLICVSWCISQDNLHDYRLVTLNQFCHFRLISFLW